jgi:transcriptional regulator with XRE-family HTH domain
MDSLRVGRSFRVLRVQRGWRQADVAERARVSRSKVSRIERGEITRIPVGDVVRVANSLGAALELEVRWHGEGLHRLIDAVHAVLVEATVRLLRQSDWDTAVEVSFNVRGERGIVDVLAYHRASRTVLVVEVKSVVPDVQAMLATLDRKARLARTIASERGWPAANVARLQVVGDGSTARRRVDLLGEMFRSAYPARGHAVKSWLQAPAGSFAGLLFLPYDRGATPGRSPATRQRVRRPAKPGTQTHALMS